MKKVLNGLVATFALCAASASANARPDETLPPCPEVCLDLVDAALAIAQNLYEGAVYGCHGNQACLDEALRIYMLNFERAMDLYDECCISVH